MLYAVIINHYSETSVSLWSNEARAQLEKLYAEEAWCYMAQMWETSKTYGVEGQKDDIEYLVGIIERIAEDEDDTDIYLRLINWNDLIDGDERLEEAYKHLRGEE